MFTFVVVDDFLFNFFCNQLKGSTLGAFLIVSIC